MFEDLKQQNTNQTEIGPVREKKPDDVQPREEDHSKETPTISSHDNERAEDIFSDLGNVSPQKALEKNLKDEERPVLNEVRNTKLPDFDEDREVGNKKRFIFIGVSVIILIGVGAFFIFLNNGSWFPKIQEIFKRNQIINESSESNEKIEENEEDINQVPEAISSSNATQANDADGDGLTDEEELKLGTNSTQVDTDKDNLSDREEIKVYKTDPLNPDTDGDTYLDGNEVQAGYNPKGPGKLLEEGN